LWNGDSSGLSRRVGDSDGSGGGSNNSSSGKDKGNRDNSNGGGHIKQSSERSSGVSFGIFIVTVTIAVSVAICQDNSTRDTANKRSLELCASIVYLFLDGCSKWYVSIVFLTG
jgi:hypothetical protein